METITSISFCLLNMCTSIWHDAVRESVRARLWYHWEQKAHVTGRRSLPFKLTAVPVIPRFSRFQVELLESYRHTSSVAKQIDEFNV